MKNYHHVLESFYNQPAAILPEKLEDIRAFLQEKAGLAARESPPAIAAGPSGGRYKITNGIGYMSLMGVIAQRMNLLMEVSGGTSTEIFGRDLDVLVNDRSVKTIVIIADSPGGSVFGVGELADKIYQARDQKKIIAVASSMAASAAYWLAAQASELVVTTGGQVGSIGVLAVHRDESKAEELAGVKTTLIHAGEYKTEGDPSQPLSSEGAAYLQRSVDAYYGMFVNAVARGRGVSAAKVRNDFGKGRMVMAAEAKQLNMVDRVATIDQVVNRLNPSSPGARAEIMHMLKAHQREDRLRDIAAQAAPPANAPSSSGRGTPEQAQRRAREVAAQVARDAAKDRND